MAEQTWEYKGFKIELTASGSFRTDLAIEGKGYIAGPSLVAVKKGIDKHLAAKAQEVELNLPVILLVKISGNGEKYATRRAVITGVDQETLEVQGLKENQNKWRGRDWEYALPDSTANDKLLAEYAATEKALEVLKEKLSARSVPTYLGGYSHKNKVAYADAIKTLQDGYAAAKKGKSDE